MALMDSRAPGNVQDQNARSSGLGFEVWDTIVRPSDVDRTPDFSRVLFVQSQLRFGTKDGRLALGRF